MVQARVSLGGARVTGKSRCSKFLTRANRGLKSFKWLYPGYSAFANDACTGFAVTVVPNSDHHTDALQVAPNRQILRKNDLAVKKKITEVALLRQGVHVADVSGIPAKFGRYNGMSTDINQGRQGSFLYIVWKSVLVV